MTTLKDLVSQYEERIKLIHSNRVAIRSATGANRTMRKELNNLKEKMKDYIAIEMERKGKTLYQICQDEFGKVDRRFHILFALFRKE